MTLIGGRGFGEWYILFRGKMTRSVNNEYCSQLLLFTVHHTSISHLNCWYSTPTLLFVFLFLVASSNSSKSFSQSHSQTFLFETRAPLALFLLNTSQVVVGTLVLVVDIELCINNTLYRPRGLSVFWRRKTTNSFNFIKYYRQEGSTT